MIGKKSMGRASHLLPVVLALGIFIATYNFITMIFHDRGLIWEVDDDYDSDKELNQSINAKLPFHVAVTASDSSYNKWQCRVMYYWYTQQKNKPGSDMGGFTRILHSGKPDNFMNEIPTIVVDPLPPGLDQGYIVLNRPWAFVQWLKKATIQEEYIMMAEPDHIFLKPMPNLARAGYPAAYRFLYIRPARHERIIRKFYPEEYGPVTNVDPIGNSPVIIKKEFLEKIAPTWVNVSLRMKADPETDKALGWVLEMYAYAIASAMHRVHHLLRKDFMLQPPFDKDTRNKYILHYTYSCEFNTKGKRTYGRVGDWRFDKRTYQYGPVLTRNLPLPPPGVPESVVTLIKMLNEATDNIPDWDTVDAGSIKPQ